MTAFESTMNEVKAELLRFGGPDAICLYLTIIEEGANRASQASAPENVQKHKDILNELNRLYRKLERSRVTEKKIHKELLNLSDDAQTFVRVELTLQLQRSVDLASEDWSNVASQRFLSVHAAVYNTFNTRRHLIAAYEHRHRRNNAFRQWREAVTVVA